MVTDPSANIISRHDYIPFGEEIPANTAGRRSEWGPQADNVNQKFTGKERDQETGLDYFGARYYGSPLGRWTSPDRLNLTEQRILSPTNTLNKYIYGANNPLRFIDPDGKDVTLFYNRDILGTGHIFLMGRKSEHRACSGLGFQPYQPSG